MSYEIRISSEGWLDFQRMCSYNVPFVGRARSAGLLLDIVDRKIANGVS